MKEKKRLSRLTAIITQLQSKKIITATTLAKKFNVSVRTIYRDIRTLEQSGIPIITEEGKGYSIMGGFYLPPVMFTENEANALVTLEKLIQNNKDQSLIEHYTNAIIKIKSVLKKSQKEKTELLSERIQIRITPAQDKKTSNYLIKVQSAITDFRLATIEYLSLSGINSKRTIEPFAIYSTNENWLLIAFCRLRKEFRVFRIDLIQKLILQNETFSPHKMTLEEYFQICKEKHTNTPDTPLS